MSGFDQKYTQDQRDSAIHAALDRHITPRKAIVELAKRGELLTPDGRKVRPFDLNIYTLRGWTRAAERRRQGKIDGRINDPDDALEGLRTRMLIIGNDELTYWERKPRGKRDHEQIRQIARMLREAAAIPRKGEGRGRAPGQKVDGVQTEGRSRAGMVGSLIAAHRAKPAPEPPSQTEPKAENADNSAHTRSEPTQERADSGSFHRQSATGSQWVKTRSPAIEPSLHTRTHTSP